MKRLQKLHSGLKEKELDAILIGQLENVRYLSGFTGSAGWLLITSNKAFLAVDFRYQEQAKRETTDFEVIQVKGDITKWFPEMISDLNVKRIGFEADYFPFATYHQLVQTISKNQFNFQLVATSGLVESLRVVKEPEELELILQAAKLTDAAFEYVQATIRPGMTEKELAWELEKFLREKGSESLPFEPIVASGPNSALPHAKPSERSILSGEPLLIDIGARIGGYCSDLSRTLYLGKPDKTFATVYQVVLGAQLAALAMIEANMNGKTADSLARTVIEEAGYGEAFGHGLGHGIGLAAHESPRLAADSSDLLTDGMVFTVEPGVYIPGWGGVRIEDVVVLEKGKPKGIAKAAKGLENILLGGNAYA